MKIFSIINKNIKILIRSRTSALIILLGPLFIVLMVGMAFNTSSLSNVKIGVYSDSYSNLSDTFVGALKDEQYIIYKSNTEKECIDGIKSGTYHMCIVFPKDLSIESNTSNEIVFYVDNSRINLVYLILDQLSRKVSLQTASLSKDLTQKIVDVLENSRVKILDGSQIISDAKTRNTNINSKASSIIDSANSLGVSFTAEELSTSALRNDTDACSNCSSSFKSQIKSFLDKIDTVSTEISSIEASKGSITTKANELKSENTANIENINKIDTNLKSIVTGIEDIKVKEAEKIVNPVKTKIQPISNRATNWNFIFPSLIALVVMFVSILLSSVLVLREKKNKAYFRNFITPTNNFTFLIGTYLTSFLILILQLLIIFGQGFFFLKSELLSVLLGVSIALFAIATVFILIGMVIGYSFQSEETSTLASMSIASIFLFISNTILPVETIPANLKWLGLFNPLVIADSLLKKLILFNASITSVLTELYLLIGYAAFFAILAYLTRELTKRKFIQ